MKRSPRLFALLLILWLLPVTQTPAQETSRVWFQAERQDYYHPKRIILRVVNPLPVDRVDEPVVVQVSKVG